MKTLRPAWRGHGGEPLLSNEQLGELATNLACGELPPHLEPALKALLAEVQRSRARPVQGSWWGDGLPAAIRAKLMAHYRTLPADPEQGPPLDLAIALLNDARLLLGTTGDGAPMEMNPPPAAVDRAWNCINDAIRRIEAGQAKLAAALANVSNPADGGAIIARWMRGDR